MPKSKKTASTKRKSGAKKHAKKKSTASIKHKNLPSQRNRRQPKGTATGEMFGLQTGTSTGGFINPSLLRQIRARQELREAFETPSDYKEDIKPSVTYVRPSHVVKQSKTGKTYYLPQKVEVEFVDDPFSAMTLDTSDFGYSPQEWQEKMWSEEAQHRTVHTIPISEEKQHKKLLGFLSSAKSTWIMRDPHVRADIEWLYENYPPGTTTPDWVDELLDNPYDRELSWLDEWIETAEAAKNR